MKTDECELGQKAHIVCGGWALGKGQPTVLKAAQAGDEKISTVLCSAEPLSARNEG